MQKIMWLLAAVVLILVVFLGGYFLWERLTQVPAAELKKIVQRDGIPIEEKTISDDVLDRLASHKVVLLGEIHFLSEHRELVAALLRELHGRGYRQFLFEWTQAADWILADYVNDGGLLPEFEPPHDIGGATLKAVRDFNRTLPEGERIQVHGIDVTLPDYGGTESFLVSLELLAGNLSDPGPIAPFLAGDHATLENHKTLLETLRAELNEDRSLLATSWGEHWYGIILEMVEVELRAVDVRALRESDYDESVRLREETIKWLVDRRIESSPHKTLINIGSTHAQKEGLWGTEGIEWLGDYLSHQSAAAEGSVLALWVPAAVIVSTPGSDGTDFDLSASPANELLKVTNQIWPDQTVFLPLDDSLFSAGRVPINSSGDIYVSAPQRHYDGLLLLPVAHRDFVGD